MIKRCMAPTGIHGSCHALDGVAFERRRSFSGRGDSLQLREVNRALVLSCLDRGIPASQIMVVLGIGRTAVWRTRAACLQGGVDLALFDVQRTERLRQYDTDAEARVTALRALLHQWAGKAGRWPNWNGSPTRSPVWLV